MGKNEALQQVVDDNFEAFQKLLPDLIGRVRGKYALMRDEEVIEFFDSARDAVIYGQKQFPDGLISVQHVTNRVVDLGYFSHALHLKNV